MLAVPASGITKTDQDGRTVSGAEFELWPAKVSDTEQDEYGFPAPVIDTDTGLYIADESKGQPICRAVTDENGHLNFITENRKIISFQEFAQSESNPQLYYVLKEVTRPTSYRSKGDISLYYSIYNKDTKEGVLLSHNYWETGAYAQAKLDVIMTEHLYRFALNEKGEPAAGESIIPAGKDETEYLDNGIIFAVPVKRMDMSDGVCDVANYYSLYGTVNTGWTLMNEAITDKESVLKAAKEMEKLLQQTRQTGSIYAERNARQLFHMEIANIPGDVKRTYPYLLNNPDEVNNSEYNIAFFFAPGAKTLDEIKNADEIIHLSPMDEKGERLERQYASQFYVSNTFNRVRVQKLDYRGNRLEGALFNMYQTYSAVPREGYIEATDDAHSGMYYNPSVVNADGTLKDLYRRGVHEPFPLCYHKADFEYGRGYGSGSFFYQ